MFSVNVSLIKIKIKNNVAYVHTSIRFLPKEILWTIFEKYPQLKFSIKKFVFISREFGEVFYVYENPNYIKFLN